MQLLSYTEKMAQTEIEVEKLEEALSLYLKEIKLQPFSMSFSISSELNGVRVIDHVPDHLEFDCETGVHIFEITRSPLQSYWAKRLR